MSSEPLLAHLRSLIVLHGILPSRGLFSHLSHLPLIAADGAGKELLQKGIRPQLIIGDLDSFNGEEFENIEILKKPDQESTDFEKAMEEALYRGLLPAFIMGIGGKELDHTLYNLQVINRYSKEYTLPFLVTDDLGRNKLGIICRHHFEHRLAPNTLISLLPFPRATVTTKGLVWDVQKAQFHQEERASIRNRVRDPLISVKVHSGSLLILFDTLLS